MVKGKTILASLIIEMLQQRKAGAVVFFYCKHDQPEKDTFTGILRGVLAQMVCKDTALASHLYEICSSKDQAGLSTMLENLAEIAFASQATSFVILDGLDECRTGEAEKALSWLLSHQNHANNGDCGHIRLLCVGQRNHVLQHMLSSAVDISLENAGHQEDVERYVKEQACRIKEEFEISSQVEEQIVTRVTNAAKSRKPALIPQEMLTSKH
jgi:NACHT domain